MMRHPIYTPEHERAAGHRPAVRRRRGAAPRRRVGGRPDTSPTTSSAAAASSASSGSHFPDRVGWQRRRPRGRAGLRRGAGPLRLRGRSRWRSRCRPTWHARARRVRHRRPARALAPARDRRRRRSARSRSPSPTRAPTSPRSSPRAVRDGDSWRRQRPQDVHHERHARRSSSRSSPRPIPAPDITACRCSSSTRRSRRVACRAGSTSSGCTRPTPPRSRSTTSRYRPPI